MMKKYYSFLLLFVLFPAQLAIAQETRFEYWLDDDYDSRVTGFNNTSESVLEIDLSTKKPGFHCLSYRTQDQSGQWGALSRLMFFMGDEADGKVPINRYEYWLDDSYDSRVIVDSSDPFISLDIDISKVHPGLHYFSIRALDSYGQWGAISRYLVMITHSDINQLKGILSWIDTSENVQLTEVTDSIVSITMDISDINKGEHSLYIEGMSRSGYRSLQTSIDFETTWLPVDASFDGLTLTVGSDTRMKNAITKVGGLEKVANSIAAIVWNSSESLTNSDMQGLENPNLLIYTRNDSLIPNNRPNVVINGMAREIVLTDVTDGNNDWYAPQAFVAERISYTRNFGQSTTKGTSRGWESIALPFDVQTIQHETKGVIAPFNNPASNKHFWLRRLTENGLQAVSSIEANTPYVISMPNSEEYTDEFNLAGLITFSSQNAQVPATVTNTLALADSSIVMVPAMQRQSRSSSVWALNVGEVRGSYFEGSVFERDYREVRPFEAYTVHRLENSQPAPRYIPLMEIGGTTGIGASLVNREEVNNEEWYDLEGRKLQGQPKQKGVYISKGKKVVVK